MVAACTAQRRQRLLHAAMARWSSWAAQRRQLRAMSDVVRTATCAQSDANNVGICRENNVANVQAVATRWMRLVSGGLAFWHDWAAAQHQAAWRAEMVRWRRERAARLGVFRAWLGIAAKRRCAS